MGEVDTEMGRMNQIGVCVAVALSLSVAISTAYAGAASCSDSGGCPDHAPLRIALMGDSYTAGNGAGHYVGPDKCFRSSHNWGSKVAGHLRDVGFDVDAKNVACSRATTAAITSSQVLSNDQHSISTIFPGDLSSTVDEFTLELRRECMSTGAGEVSSLSNLSTHVFGPNWAIVRVTVTATCTQSMKPQADQLPADTDLVFMTLGGNDIGFSQIVEDCFFATRVADIVENRLDPYGYVLRRVLPKYNERCKRDVRGARNATRSGGVLESSLTDAIVSVQRQLSGGARGPGEIVLVSYPYLDEFPDELSDGYPVGQKLKALSDAGDQVERQAVENANRYSPEEAKVVFVDDVKDAFAGHEPTGSAMTSNPDGYLWELPEIPGGGKDLLKRVAKNIAESIASGLLRGHGPEGLADDGLSGLEKGFGPTIFSYYHPNPVGQSALAGAVEGATDAELIERFCGAGTPLQLVPYEDGQPLDPSSSLHLVATRTVIVTVYNEDSEAPRVYTATTDSQGRFTVPNSFVGWGQVWLDTGLVIGDGCQYNARGSADLSGHGPSVDVEMDFGCIDPPGSE